MSLHEKIVKVAKKYPKHTAVIDSATGKSYNYKKLLTASFILSGIIKKSKDEFTGVLLPSSAGAFISILAILISGKTPVMINYSTGAEKNILYAKRKGGFKTIITSRKLCQRLNIQLRPGMIILEDVISSTGIIKKIYAFFQSLFPLSFIAKSSPGDIAVLLFTTGSEKDPKTVMLTHDNIISNVESLHALFEFDSSDVFCGVLPLFHVYGLTTSYFLPLLSGATVNTFVNPLEFPHVVRGIKNNHATIITATPTFLHGYSRVAQPGDIKTLRIIMAGGDKLTANLKDSYLNKHGLRILEGYGTTETSPVISVNTFEKNKFGSIGQPVPGTKVKIIDIDTEQPLPPGQEGKIYVKGRLVMKGYFDDMEETALRIRNGWYDTGDIGIIDKEGFLWHRGRLKRFIKTGGEMISLVSVENAVEKHLGDEQQCCAIEIPHISKGAEIILAVTSDTDKTVLRKKLIKELPPIAVPKKIFDFRELPMMANGKVNFRAVEEMCRRRISNEKKD